MFTFIRVFCFLVLCGWCAPAQAKLTILPGWSYSQSQDGVVMFTPCGGGSDMVVYGIYPAYRSSAANRIEWMRAQVSLHANGWAGRGGSVLAVSDVAEQGPVMYQTVEVTDGTANRWSVVAVGVFVGQLGQFYAIAAPSTVDEHDERVQAALTHIFGLIKENFALDPRSITGTPLRNLAGVRSDETAQIGLQSSELRYFAKNRISPGPRVMAVTQAGRFYEGQVSDFGVTGTVRLLGNEANGAYELKHGDGSLDLIPTSCAFRWPSDGSSAAPPPAAPVAAAPPAQAPPVARTCRTVIKRNMRVQTQMQCTLRGCSPVQIPVTTDYEDEVCD